MINSLGFLAGILTSISVVPQLVKALKTKKADDVSLGMFLLYDAGLFLWIIYGYFIFSMPVLIMNSFAFLTSAWMTYLKLKYKN